MIDTHCHIAGDEFVADLAEVVARAQAAGVDRAICILASDEPEELARVATVRAAWPAVRFAAGIHPHASGKYAGRVADSVAMTTSALAAVGDAVALGEIGLDYHYDFAPKDVQREIFAGQIALAVEKDLPVVIHSREAMADTVDVLKAAGQGKVRGVIHCFTGTHEELSAYLEMGLHIGITGWICDERRGLHLRELVKEIPLDRLMIETDAPFLTPRNMPMKPKDSRNEPAFLTHVLKTLADCLGKPPAFVALETTRTATEFFRIGSKRPRKQS